MTAIYISWLVSDFTKQSYKNVSVETNELTLKWKMSKTELTSADLKSYANLQDVEMWLVDFRNHLE